MPEPPAPRPASSAALLASVGAALAVFMILALVSPRWTSDEGTNWVIALVGGLIAAVLTYVFLATRGREKKETKTDSSAQ